MKNLKTVLTLVFFLLITGICSAQTHNRSNYGYVYTTPGYTHEIYISTVVSLSDYAKCIGNPNDGGQFDINVGLCLKDAFVSSLSVIIGDGYTQYLTTVKIRDYFDNFLERTQANSSRNKIIAEYKAKGYKIIYIEI